MAWLVHDVLSSCVHSSAVSTQCARVAMTDGQNCRIAYTTLCNSDAPWKINHAPTAKTQITPTWCAERQIDANLMICFDLLPYTIVRFQWSTAFQAVSPDKASRKGNAKPIKWLARKRLQGKNGKQAAAPKTVHPCSVVKTASTRCVLTCSESPIVSCECRRCGTQRCTLHDEW